MRTALPAVMLLLLLAAGPAAAQDARAPAPRTPTERAFILNQMRLFLGSVRAISVALAEGDMKTVATEAAARGRTGTPVSDIPPTMKAKETASWTAMMGGVRKGFDQIAASATAGAPPVQVLREMGDTMRNCVACHQTYRLVDE